MGVQELKRPVRQEIRASAPDEVTDLAREIFVAMIGHNPTLQNQEPRWCAEKALLLAESFYAAAESRK